MGFWENFIGSADAARLVAPSRVTPWQRGILARVHDCEGLGKRWRQGRLKVDALAKVHEL